MAKNMTRKGLALGSVFTLGLSGVVGLPAQAAPGIDLADLYDTGLYTMIENEPFTFKAGGNVDWSGTASQLRVHVENLSGGTAAGIKINGTALTSSNDITLIDGSSTDTSLGTTIGDTAVFGLGDGAASVMVSPFTFSFTEADVANDAPMSFAVKVFQDADNDGVVDAGEYVSASKTVTFIATEDVEVTITPEAFIQGDTQLSGTFDLNGIDDRQISGSAGDFGIYMTNASSGADLAKDGADGDTDPDPLFDAVSWNATDLTFEWSTVAWSGTPAAAQADSLAVAIAKDLGIKFQAIYNAAGSVAYSDTALGTAATRTAVNKTVGSITADVVNSTVSEKATDTFLAGDSTFKVGALVKDLTSPTAVVMEGVAVTAKVEVANITLSSTVASGNGTLTVNGTKYTDATKLPGASATAPKLALVTDAEGMVYVELSTEDFSAAATADTITVTFYVENLSSAITATAADASYKMYVTNADEVVVTTDGTAASLQVEVRDQFGGFLADGYDARAIFDATATASAGAQATTAATSASSTATAITGGKATLSILDNGTGAGTNVYDLSVYERVAGGAYAGSATASIADFPVKIVTALPVGNKIGVTIADSDHGDDADTAAYELTDANGSTPGTDGWALELADFIDGFASRQVVGATVPTLNAQADLAGTFTVAATSTSAAVNVAGAPVTFSGSGLQFVANVDQNGDGTDEQLYGIGSITTYTDANGGFDVKVSSNVAGKQTVTITAGGVSQTVIISFEGAGALTGTAWDLSGVPANVEPGYSFSIAAKLVDKYGNAVETNASKVKISWNGPIFTVPSTLPSATDADGIIKFGVVPAANEVGTYTYTVSYAGADDTFDTSDDLTATKSVTIGAAGNAGDLSTWTKKLDDTSLKMYAKNVIGAGKVQFKVNGDEIAWTRANDVDDVEGASLRSANGAYYLVRTVDDRYLVSGRNVLTIVVDGVTTTTRIFYMD